MPNVMEINDGRVNGGGDKNVLRHKEREHAACDHEPGQYAGLRCRQGPHRTFSPSVSCTALGSAARLALPLAWAICRYMDV